MLVLKQPADASKADREASHQCWRERQVILKGALPLLSACSLVLLEMVALGLWLQDALFSLRGFLRLLVAAAVPFLSPFVVFFAAWLFGSTKSAPRALRLHEEGIKFSQTEYGRVQRRYVQWRHVRRWFIAPVPGKNDLVTLTLERGSTTKPSRVNWSMVVDNHEQIQAFLAEIKSLRQAGRTEAPVIVLTQPIPARKLALNGVWAVAVAFYLLVHGLPLLVAVLPHDSKGRSSRLTPGKEAKMERVANQMIRLLHINNEAQLRLFLAIPGAVLTTAAICVFVWGIKRWKQQATELNRLYDLELERICYPASRPQKQP